MHTTGELVVLVTVASRDQGESMGEALVGERLAACVNIVGPVRSVYRWQGEICRDEEHLLVIKTTRERFEALEARVRALHSYQVPECVALSVDAGSRPYLAWLRAQC